LNDELNKVGFIKNYESDRINKSGKRITTSLTQSLIHDKDNKVIGSSAIIRDITELKKLKIQMSHSEKLSVVGQLASGIAHEVGNPLTSISSLIQVLTRQTDDENLKTNLNLVKKQTDRISKLIRDLVTFSQPSDFKIIPTDINTLITEAVEIIKYDKRAQHCEIDVHLVKKLPLTEVPADQLQQVLINLLLNALDALPSENGKISIYSFSGDGSISIKIKDNGRGIPKTIIDKIFEPFFTTKGVGKGTGLGLWVSYSIMESINGKIIVDSKETVGSTFTLEIPIIP
jgi:C4-dicarboxylate-specific signal transduction histidine kinase